MPERVKGSFPNPHIEALQPGQEAFHFTSYPGVYASDRNGHSAARLAIATPSPLKLELTPDSKIALTAANRGAVLTRLRVLPRLGAYSIRDVVAVRRYTAAMAELRGEEARVVDYDKAAAQLERHPNAKQSELARRWQLSAFSGSPQASFWSFYKNNRTEHAGLTLERIGISDYSGDQFLGYEVYKQPAIPDDVAWYHDFWRGVFDKAEVLYRPKQPTD